MSRSRPPLLFFRPLGLLALLQVIGCDAVVDADADGFAAPEDCDDDDPAVRPGAEELCNDVDDDCDGSVDEGVTLSLWPDGDGDGYGAGSQPAAACEAPEGYVERGDDCDDHDPAIHPGAQELCNGVDDNCDGISDDGVVSTWFADNDGDGYGDAGEVMEGCPAPSGYVADGTDCDDSDAGVHPGAEEVCDLDDDDCDGRVDQGKVSVWYEDDDGDGYGDPEVYESTCDPAAGWVQRGGDCAAADPAVHPGAAERCNAMDDDCDGAVDEDYDLDGDGFMVEECADLLGGEPDCDDDSAQVHPDAKEICDDGLDNDCDDGDRRCGLDGSYDLAKAEGKFHASQAGYDAGRLVDVGDVNGDGLDDAVVTTLLADNLRGGGYLLYGPFSGSSDLATAGHRFTGPNNGSGPGRSLGLGDANGDGFDDIVFGAPYAGSDSAYVIFGPVSGDMDIVDADVLLEGEDQSYFGHGADLADVNADGYADALIGSYRDDIGGDCAGAAYLKYGPLSADYAFPDDADAVLIGEAPANYTGRSTRAGVDVNGDGVGDMLVPANRASDAGTASGRAYLVFGPVSGSLELSSADGIYIGESPSDYAGSALAMGDVDGDGLGDVAVGSFGNAAGNYTGAAYVILGPATGTVYLGKADVIVRGSAQGQQAGLGLAIDDVDGDGKAELLLGAPADNTAGSAAGAAYLFFGPLTGSYTTADAPVALVGEAGSDNAGQGVAIADLDGSGWSELLVGAPGEATGGSGAGAVYVKYAQE